MTEVATAPTPAVTSAVRVLDAISAASTPLSFSQLQVQLDLPKSSLSRLLQTMAGLELIDLYQGRYQMGPRVLDYSASYIRRLDVINVFHRVADEIGERIDETMQLAQLQGREAVFLAKRDCSRMIRPAAYPGRRVPAHATAVGKAMLADVPLQDLHRLYPEEGLPALTPHTIVRRAALEAELLAVQQAGYARTRQESTLNLCCFSSPVRDATGAVIAALSICLATDEPDPLRRETAIQSALLGAKRISSALGYRSSLPDSTPSGLGPGPSS